jgi:hypothetical protein
MMIRTIRRVFGREQDVGAPMAVPQVPLTAAALQ